MHSNNGVHMTKIFHYINVILDAIILPNLEGTMHH